MPKVFIYVPEVTIPKYIRDTFFYSSLKTGMGNFLNLCGYIHHMFY